MQLLMIQWLSVVVAGGGADAPNSGEQSHARSAPATLKPTITVKDTDPVRVAYLEHVGPYWMAGPVFRRVGEYMRERAQPGPMFVRYLDNPASVPPRSLRSEIGFFIEGDLTPEPPFEVKRRGPERVAHMVLDDPHTGTRRCHARMHVWIEGHGYKPAGPITEVYAAPFLTGAGANEKRTEIQILLQPPKRVDGVGITQQDSRVSIAHQPVENPDPGRAMPTLRDADETNATTADPSVPPAVGKPPLAAVAPPPAKDEPNPPIKELIAASRFDRIAELLMPDEHAIPRNLRVWLGQTVFLIGAVAKGVEQMYPGEGQTVTAVAEALSRRYRIVSANDQLRSIDQTIIRVDPHGDPLAAGKRVIMRDLSSLLARISHRSVDADSATNQLGSVLQQVYDLTLATHRGL